MKGCSSLGRLRYAVLLGVGPKKEKEFCLVDIKEAVRAAAPAAGNAGMPKDFAKRVVTGARNLSPFLGERMLAAKFLSRSVVLRELMPQDLKLEAERMVESEAVMLARYLANVVGRAHARQMDESTNKLTASPVSCARMRTRRRSSRPCYSRYLNPRNCPNRRWRTDRLQAGCSRGPLLLTGGRIPRTIRPNRLRAAERVAESRSPA